MKNLLILKGPCDEMIAVRPDSIACVLGSLDPVTRRPKSNESVLLITGLNQLVAVQGSPSEILELIKELPFE